MDEHRAVGLEHQHPGGQRQVRGQPSGVVDLAAGDDDSHERANLQWPRDRPSTYAPRERVTSGCRWDVGMPSGVRLDERRLVGPMAWRATCPLGGDPASGRAPYVDGHAHLERPRRSRSTSRRHAALLEAAASRPAVTGHGCSRRRRTPARTAAATPDLREFADDVPDRRAAAPHLAEDASELPAPASSRSAACCGPHRTADELAAFLPVAGRRSARRRDARAVDPPPDRGATRRARGRAARCSTRAWWRDSWCAAREQAHAPTARAPGHAAQRHEPRAGRVRGPGPGARGATPATSMFLDLDLGHDNLPAGRELRIGGLRGRP